MEKNKINAIKNSTSYFRKSLIYLFAVICLFINLSVGNPYAAVAAAQQTVYDPSLFARTYSPDEITDYSTDGQSFAIIDGESLIIISPDGAGGEMTLKTCDTGLKTAVAVEYADGFLYVGCDDGLTYLYNDGQLEPRGYEFGDNVMVRCGEYYYFFDGDRLCALHGTLSELGTGFSLLKGCSSFAYAVKDNTLFKLNGTQPEPVVITYTDLTGFEIFVGETMTNLKTGYQGKIMTLPKDTYITQIDLDRSTDVFFQIKTVKLTAQTNALELCRSGNASVIMTVYGGQTAIFITQTPEDGAYSPFVPTKSEYAMARALDEVKLYSCPFESVCTQTGSIPQGAEVYIIEQFKSDFSEKIYYKVTFLAGEASVTGYVEERLLQPFSPVEEGTEKNDDGINSGVSETVVMVIVIFALVVIAVAYLTVFGAKGRKKRDGADGGDKR